MRISDWSSDVCSSDLGVYPNVIGRSAASRCKPSKINPVVQVEVEAAIRVHKTGDQRRETTIIFRRHPPRPLRLNQYGLKHAGVQIHQRLLQEVYRQNGDFLLLDEAVGDLSSLTDAHETSSAVQVLNHIQPFLIPSADSR